MPQIINGGPLIWRATTAKQHEWAIVDLDGTLANHNHRLPYAKSANPNWDVYNEMRANDPVNPNILFLVESLRRAGLGICIMTAASAKYANGTVQWLEKHSVPKDLLLMREHGDQRFSCDVKFDLYQSYFLQTGRRVRLVLEDRDKLVAMWREIGLTCLQVCKGEY
jgi:hypothetical protein